MSDEKSIFPQIETGYAFLPYLNGDLVEKFNNQPSTQDSAILKTKCFNPKDLIVQHLPVKEGEKKIEVSRMRNGYIVNVLNSVDDEETVKIGGKAIDV